MSNIKPFGFALSQEEVLVVLGYLKGTGILGFDKEAFKDLTKREIQLVMEATERSLISRGFIQAMGDKLVLNDNVQAVVGVCQFPEVSWAVLNQKMSPPTEQYYFHAVKQSFILHGIPMSGIHQFLSLPGREAGLRSVLSILQMKDTLIDDQCVSGQISRNSMEEAQQAASQKDSQKVENILIAAGLTPKTATALAQSLIERTSYTSLVRIEQSSVKGGGTGIAVLQSSGKLWLLSSMHEKDGTWTKVESVSDEKIIVSLKSLFG